jgi:hypothetical protein
MKLHLGCGQRYLSGYVNIDFPLTEHSVQNQTVADLHADILAVSYPAGTIEEVRLHHVFEHFTRPVACALLSAWHIWLKPRGRVHIEVPDLGRMAAVLINPFSSVRRKAVAERHLFGSHEARWAAHYEGYSAGMLLAVMDAFGFESTKVRRNAWRGTHNIEVLAYKSESNLSNEELAAGAQRYLKNYLVDDSESEQKLLETWMGIYREQFSRSLSGAT